MLSLQELHYLGRLLCLAEPFPISRINRLNRAVAGGGCSRFLCGQIGNYLLMNSIIYLVGLIVIILAILSFLGLR